MIPMRCTSQQLTGCAPAAAPLLCHVPHTRRCPVTVRASLFCHTRLLSTWNAAQAQAPWLCCADPIGGETAGGVEWPKGLQRSARLHRHIVLADLHHSILGTLACL